MAYNSDAARWRNQDIAMLYLYHMFIGAARDDSLPEIINPRKPTETLNPERTGQVADILRAGYVEMARECEEYLVERGLMTRNTQLPPASSGIVRSTALPRMEDKPPPTPSLVEAIQSAR